MRILRPLLLLYIVLCCAQILAQGNDEKRRFLKIGLGATVIPEFSHSGRFHQHELFGGPNLYVGLSKKLKRGRLRVNPVLGFNYFQRSRESIGKQKFLSLYLSSDYSFDFVRYKSFSYYMSLGTGAHLNSNIQGPCFTERSCEFEKDLSRLALMFSFGSGFRIEPRNSKFGIAFDNEVELAFDNLIRVHINIELMIKL